MHACMQAPASEQPLARMPLPVQADVRSKTVTLMPECAEMLLQGLCEC